MSSFPSEIYPNFIRSTAANLCVKTPDATPQLPRIDHQFPAHPTRLQKDTLNYRLLDSEQAPQYTGNTHVALRGSEIWTFRQPKS